MANYVPLDKRIEIDDGLVSCIKFSPKGNRLLCCTSTGYGYLFSFPELNQIVKKELNNKGINEVAFSNDGSFFVTAGDDNSAIIAETETLNVLRRFRGGKDGHQAEIYCCAISSDNSRIITGSKDVSFKIWDPRVSTPVQEVGGHTEPVSSVSYNYDNTLILSGSFDGIVRIWDSASYICLRTYVVDGNPISKCLFTPNSDYIAIFSLEAQPRIVEVKSGEIYRLFDGHVNTKFRVEAKFLRPELNQTGELMATSEDSSIIGWDVATSNIAWKVQTDGLTNVCDAFDNGQYIAYAPMENPVITLLERKE